MRATFGNLLVRGILAGSTLGQLWLNVPNTKNRSEFYETYELKVRGENERRRR